MNTEKKRKNLVWIVMLVLSILFLMVTIPMLTLTGGTDLLKQILIYAGSTFDVKILDQATLGTMSMAMLKPLWEEIWIGILGIYCAVGLKSGKKHAWTLSLFWGIMMISNAAIQGIYELVVLKWATACLQTYFFLVVGVVAVLSMLITRKKYFRDLN